jgi:hypothetical protein
MGFLGIILKLILLLFAEIAVLEGVKETDPN